MIKVLMHRCFVAAALMAAVTVSCSKAYAEDRKEKPHEEPAAAPEWMEVPVLDRGPYYHFFTHYMTDGEQTQRNYSFYWSENDKVSFWVAYPMNAGLMGVGRRPNPQPWAKDPLLEKAGLEQPDVSLKFKGYTRGHQIASADRYLWDSNAQTYYSSNMTPQLYDVNGFIWVTLEQKVRDWSRRCDTLYVVSGCVIENSTEATLCGDVEATVPTAYWKALLRYNSARTSGYGGYSGCGVFVWHKGHSQSDVISSRDAMPLSALEKKVGIKLFPLLDSVLGKKLAAKVKDEDPRREDFWGW